MAVVEAGCAEEIARAGKLLAEARTIRAKRQAELVLALDAEIAELERLRPNTGEPHETSSDDQRLLAGPAGNITDGGGTGVSDAGTSQEGEPDSAPEIQTGHS